MRRFLSSAVLFAFIQPVPASAADAYLCIAEKATGFRFDKATTKWVEAIFRVDEKYILKKKDDAWFWREFGKEDKDWGKCDQKDSNGYIECYQFISHVTFFEKTLRFQIIQETGYLTGNLQFPGNDEEGANDPSITIGICSPL